MAFFLAARRTGSCFNQSGNLILGKGMKNACAITNWFLGFGLCKQFAKFCFVFGF